MLPLHVACANGHAEVARKLLTAMASHTDINVMDESGNTCLHWAAIAGYSHSRLRQFSNEPDS